MQINERGWKRRQDGRFSSDRVWKIEEPLTNTNS